MLWTAAFFSNTYKPNIVITLKTLAEATEQQVFDQVKNHLLTQNAVSKEMGCCLYRSSNGTKCAAGCLISDEEYVKIVAGNWEGAPWSYLIARDTVPSTHASLIEQLQNIHDVHMVESWPKLLESLAKSRGLIYENTQVELFTT